MKQHGDWVSQLVKIADIFYVFRDGRDVLSSLHLFMQKYDATGRCSLGQFIRQDVNGISRPRIWANHVMDWLNQSNVHILKFEQIIANPYQSITDIGKLLGLTPLYVKPLLPKSLQNLWESRWVVLTEFKPESTAHITGKKPLKWLKTWSHADRKFFHQEAGNVLVHLGYEVSDKWV